MTHLPAPSVPFADRQEGRLPGWLTRWWETLHPYAHYAGARPRLIFLFSPGAGWLPSAILVIAVLWISWQWCDSDLLLAIGFSIAAFQLMFPFQIYNEVLLLPAVLWLLLQRRERRRRSQLFTLLLSCLWIVLGNGWTSALGLSVVNLLYPGSAGRFIAFPMLSVWLLPYAVFWLFSSMHWRLCPSSAPDAPRSRPSCLANPLIFFLCGFCKDQQNRGINAPPIPAMLFSEFIPPAFALLGVIKMEERQVKIFKNLLHDESGQDLIEYALVAALIALGAITAMRGLATGISTAFNTISSDLTSAVA